MLRGSRPALRCTNLPQSTNSGVWWEFQRRCSASNGLRSSWESARRSLPVAVSPQRIQAHGRLPRRATPPTVPRPRGRPGRYGVRAAANGPQQSHARRTNSQVRRRPVTELPDVRRRIRYPRRRFRRPKSRPPSPSTPPTPWPNRPVPPRPLRRPSFPRARRSRRWGSIHRSARLRPRTHSDPRAFRPFSCSRRRLWTTVGCSPR